MTDQKNKDQSRVFSAAAHTGCECDVQLILGPPQGNSTETTLVLDVAGGGQDLAIKLSKDKLRVEISIFGDWEREGLLACLAKVLKAAGQ